MSNISISEQIKSNMMKAFYDLINDTVNSDNPDYNWLCILYTELKERLLHIVPKDSKVYNQIDQEFDVQIFKQMIENDVFNFDSMSRLINSSFSWVEKLQAPCRDESTKEAKNRVINSDPKNIIASFLKEIHMCIDKIEDDIVSFYTDIQKNNS